MMVAVVIRRASAGGTRGLSDTHVKLGFRPSAPGKFWSRQAEMGHSPIEFGSNEYRSARNRSLYREALNPYFLVALFIFAAAFSAFAGE
jgi:hypothetical protein